MAIVVRVNNGGSADSSKQSFRIKQANAQRETSRKVSKEMRAEGGITEFMNPARMMMAAEKRLGSAYIVNVKENTMWVIQKNYNVVSNLENYEWMRGSTVGLAFIDEDSFGPCLDKTVVELTTCQEFGMVRRLSGRVMDEDCPDLDELESAMNFCKLRDGLSYCESRIMKHMLFIANALGENHLTRLVRGVLLSLACDLSENTITLKGDKNRIKWMDYTPDSVRKVAEDNSGSAIWCANPKRHEYGSILAHLTHQWNCDGMPLRISNITIPSEGNTTYIISLGKGEVIDVVLTSKKMREALNTYAQSMGCEDILQHAYCIGSMLLKHECWPAVHLPTTIWYSDLIRPAMTMKNGVSVPKREWTLRDAMVLSKYAADALGLALKESMSSCWDHYSESLSHALSRISCVLRERNDLYRWLAVNIIGEDAGYLFHLDPLCRVDETRIEKINDTSMLKYWYLNEIKQVGGESLCGVMLCSIYTRFPCTGTDTRSARELGFLRQLGVVKNGPLYKREIRLKKIVVDKEKKKLIDSSIREGTVSVLADGLSVVKSEWPMVKDSVNDDDVDYVD